MGSPLLARHAIFSRVRSEICSRSNWARAIMIVVMTRPEAEAVLISSLRETSLTSYRSNSSTRVRKSTTFREIRSILVKTTMSTRRARTLVIRSEKPGRSRSFPERPFRLPSFSSPSTNS